MVHETSLRGRRGYSLVELLIVLLIIAMMALAVTPRLIKVAQRSQVKSAAREVAITLQAARMSAVRRDRQVSVVIASGTALPVQFDTIEPPPPAPTPTRVPRRLSLPPNSARLVVTPTGGIITFAGDGRVSSPGPFDLTLEGPVSATVRNQITVRTSTNGRIEVITPTAWQ
jgi:prepilin-type N-terminal cleavage/methylation domain-containing protein